MKRVLIACILATALCACQRNSAETPAADAAAEATGWLDANGAGETAIVYKDSADSPGFSLSCAQATKSFHVSAPNPVEGAPIDRETATLILGDQAFLVPVTPGAGPTPTLEVETPAIPKLLRAVADSRSARLAFRDGFVETGVDTEGKLLAFSARCGTLTGVAPGP
ncbi:MAG: hypothetical protein IV086_18275 [Hyphomonadaceae bacterium]|nr:MAG: hypothetical protein FD160_3462 [Caulobacteraceae bacterium]MBT9447645.1 hypothetical protein [Hyphomonadaceae bacterium]TPW07228.1 MAG: hypothetical protein FD124_1301 [Alphaproteobacteria bacterium]